MSASGGDGFVESHEDELKSLAEAVAEAKAPAVASAGAALLVKVLTGSSIAAGAAEKAATKVFGQWLADTPDTRLQQAAEAFRQADRKQEALRAFADQVEPLIAFGLRSVHAAIGRIEQGQSELGSELQARADDLEGLLGQSLRATALIAVSQGEMQALLVQVKTLLQARADRASQPPAATGTAQPPFPGTSASGDAPTALDFFVSYTSADAHWAEWIAWSLEAAGHTVRLQKWDFRPGTNFVLEMHRAASQATRTLAVLSAAYAESQFGQAEWAVAFSADPTGAQRKLIPVRVAECKPPGLLGPIVYVDLFGKGEDDARSCLLDGVRVERGKPTTAPVFPGAAAAVGPAASSSQPKPVFPGDIPAVWNVPFQSSRFFVGRGALLEEVHHALQSNPAKRAVLWGLGGIGKTQLAVEYIYAHKLVDFDAVLWVSADSPETLRANLAALCSAVLQLPEGSEKELAVQLGAVERWLKEHSRWLLVLDNVDTEEAADAVVEFVQRLPPRHVLVTSRRSIWPSDFASVEVSKLPLDVATDFVLQRTAHANKPALGTVAEAREVARELDGLPLALEQAAAYLLRKRIRFASYRAKLTEALRYTLKGGTASEKSVFSTWLVTEDALSPEARTILRLACWFSSDPIGRALFVTGDGGPFCKALSLSGAEPTDEDVVDVIERGIVELADYSLIDCAATEFSMHRLVATVQRERLPSGVRAIWVKAALEALATHTRCDAYDVRSASILGPCQQHIAEVVRHADGTGIADPTATLMGRLAAFFDTHARYHEAEPLMRRALAIDEASYGKEHPRVAIHLNNLGSLLQATNRLGEAEPLMRRALALAEASYGKEHPDVATNLNNLAQLLQATNRLGEAEPLMRRALAIDEASYGKEHPRIARDLNNLGSLLRATNRLGEAEPLMRRALAIDEASYGKEHPRVARDLNNLGSLLKATNRLGEAEPLMRRALAIDEASYGKEHPDVARDLNDLGSLLKATNRLGEAEPLMRRALAIDEASYGKEHPDVARDLNNLAQLLKTTNRLGEAEPLMRRALAIFDTSLGATHPSTETVRRNLEALLAEMANN